jgi:hypothetical protein
MRSLLACTVAALLAIAGSLISTQTTAAQEDTKTKSAKPGPSATNAMKVSMDGFEAMRSIHAARVAIFNGDPKVCGEMLTKANEDLIKAAKDETAAKMKTDSIAIDGSMALADTFVPSEKKAGHIAKANEHFKAGHSKEGLEELKLGEIDVSFTRILMPLEATKKRLATAIALANEHKYYECNLALKAAEDGIETDSVSLFEVPQSSDKNIKPAKSEK